MRDKVGDRREREIRVVCEIGEPGEAGSGEKDCRSESGRDATAERIWGVVVRRTILRSRGMPLLWLLL